MDVRKHIPLAEYTRLKIGGPARLFVEVTNVDEVRAALQLAAATSVPWAVLGAGTATLVADQGFDGLIIRCLGSARDYLPGGSLVFAGDTIPGLGSIGAAALHGQIQPTEITEYHWLDAKAAIHTITNDQWATSTLPHAPGIVVGIVPKTDIRRPSPHPSPSLPSAQVFLPQAGSAAAAIADVGWAGKPLGRVKLWEQDPTWLVAEPGARADEVVELMSLVKQQVRDTLGIQLRDAVAYLGM